MVLTEEQFHELQQIVADYHSAFIVNNIAPGAVPKETLDRLKRLGLVNVRATTVEDAYIYGLVSALADAPKMDTYEQYRAYIKANPVPLTPIERQAVIVANLSAGQYVTGLGVRVAQDIASGVMQTDAEARQALRDEVRTQTEQAVATRSSLQELASDIGHATGDWTRDLRRIANTEMQMAMQQGTAQRIVGEEGKDAQVVVLASQDCCPSCGRLYRTDDGTPRIFTIGELEANGTNKGRKQAEWLPVVPPCHPNCRCGVHWLPKGMGIDRQGHMVTLAQLQRTVARPVFVLAKVFPGGLPKTG